MDTLATLAVAAIVLAAFAYALWPLAYPAEALAYGSQDGEESEVSRLLADRERAYRNIQEIDMDREMEKLSEEDYAEMIGRARSAALDVLRRLEARGVGEGMAPASLGEREAARAAAGAEPVTGGNITPLSPDQALDARLETEILVYRQVASPAGEPAGDASSLDGQGRDGPEINFCPACGVSVSSGDNFCASCGKKLS